MIKINDLSKAKDINLDKDIIYSSSSLEYIDEYPKVKIGYGVKFLSANITLYENAELTIGDLSEIRGRIIVGPNCKVKIGYGLICNDSIFIHANDLHSITIGDDCLFANVRIYNSDMHSIFDEDNGERINNSKDIVIENKVWAARDTLILKGTKLGNNTVIGAGSVVCGQFPERIILAGNPAKEIKKNCSWSRTLSKRKSKIITTSFPLSKFRSYAIRFLHNEVISLGMPAWDNRFEMTSDDYYVIYYLCRSILISCFLNHNQQTITIHDKQITLHEIFDALFISFEKSGLKNMPCGSYARLAALLLKQYDKAEQIYKMIKPIYPEIDRDIYNL